jgi:hypothetical protein
MVLDNRRMEVREIGETAGISKVRVGYTECTRRKEPNFGRVFLRSNYTDIT